MGYYPIAIDITGKPCLIVGGGRVAIRKAGALLEAGAEVTLLSPDVDDSAADLSGIEIIRREFAPGDTAGYVLVIAATDNREINALVSAEAEQNHALVNVVDDPELCTFIVPAVVRRGDLIISISTSGSSPALAGHLRRQIEEEYGPEYEALTMLLKGIRGEIRAKYARQSDREAAYVRLLHDNGEILDLLRSGREEEARKKALQCI